MECEDFGGEHVVVGRWPDARSARSHALSVLRVRGAALAAALLPAAVAVILLVGGATGRLGAGWDAARWAASAAAVLVLAVAAGVASVIARARPAHAPTVPVPEGAAPDLYALVRELAQRLDVPAPSAIALTPDCDSWLEERPRRPEERPHRSRPDDGHTGAGAPVLVIGSPFLWWMRVPELRALLAPVVAGTGPSAHPDIAAARRFVRGLDAAVAAADSGAGSSGAGHRGAGSAGSAGSAGGPERAAGSPVEDGRRGGGFEDGARGGALSAVPGAAAYAGSVRAVTAAAGGLGLRFAGRCARLMLRASAAHATEMERGVAAAAADRAQGVDHGLRVTAQEQVGLAYAGWDRLLTRVALPAWRIGRWPARLDAGVVAALTELSRRDRLAEGFAARLGERPACDLLEEPGAVDESVSLLAARLFHGGPPRSSTEWSPVSWQAYPEEVAGRSWRTAAARLVTALDDTSTGTSADVSAGASASGSGSAAGAARTAEAELPDAAGEFTGCAETPEAAGTAEAADVSVGASAGGSGSAAGAACTAEAELPGAAGEFTGCAEPPETAGTAEAAEVAETAGIADAAGTAEARETAEARGPGASDEPAGAEGAPGAPGTVGAAADARQRPRQLSGAAARPSPARLLAHAVRAARPAGPPEPPPGPGPYANSPHTPGTSPASQPSRPSRSSQPSRSAQTPQPGPPETTEPATEGSAASAGTRTDRDGQVPTLERIMRRLADDEDATELLAARLSTALAREEASRAPGPLIAGAVDESAVPPTAPMGLPLQPPRTGAELVAEHVVAAVCCAAVDTAAATPGLDWLDGPVLLVRGERTADLHRPVLDLVETGEPRPLRDWLTTVGVRADEPLHTR